MKPVTVFIAILMTQCLLPVAYAQIGDSDTVAEDVPGFPVPELRNYIPELAKAVDLIGQNRVEDSFNSLKTELNPAFRNEGAHEKFRESWMKLFMQIGRLRLEFDSYD
ncbi:MAG: hypothetical protein ISQ06_15830, partial [Planctomycetaceae bacterium]|nr:hypothetical protein [Planctomycetaceae bacterium]